MIKELKPWLTEFAKLGERGKNAIELMDLYRSGDNLEFWSKYVKSRMSAEDKKAYEAHKSGTMKLQPFYDFAMDDLGDAFYEKLSGEKAFTLRGIGSYKNLKTTQAGLMFVRKFQLESFTKKMGTLLKRHRIMPRSNSLLIRRRELRLNWF